MFLLFFSVSLLSIALPPLVIQFPFPYGFQLAYSTIWQLSIPCKPGQRSMLLCSFDPHCQWVQFLDFPVPTLKSSNALVCYFMLDHRNATQRPTIVCTCIKCSISWIYTHGTGRDHRFREWALGKQGCGQKNSFRRTGNDQHLEGITFSCFILLHVHDNLVKQELLSQKLSPQFYNSMPVLMLFSLLKIISSTILLSANLPSKGQEQA